MIYSLPGITTTTSKSEVQPVIVSVTEDGTLKTHDVLGYAMVLVTATDDQGLIHTLNFIVQVRYCITKTKNCNPSHSHILIIINILGKTVTFHDAELGITISSLVENIAKCLITRYTIRASSYLSR